MSHCTAAGLRSVCQDVDLIGLYQLVPYGVVIFSPSHKEKSVFPCETERMNCAGENDKMLMIIFLLSNTQHD